MAHIPPMLGIEAIIWGVVVNMQNHRVAYGLMVRFDRAPKAQSAPGCAERLLAKHEHLCKVHDLIPAFGVARRYPT